MDQFIEGLLWTMAWLLFLIYFDVATMGMVYWVSFSVMMVAVMVKAWIGTAPESYFVCRDCGVHSKKPLHLGGYCDICASIPRVAEPL